MSKIAKYIGEINIYDIILSIIISASIVMMTRTHFGGSVWDMSDKTYMSSFGIPALILFIVCMFILIIVLPVLYKYLFFWIRQVSKKQLSCVNENIIIAIWGVIIFLSWTPYYLSYYPGGLYADTVSAISWISSGYLTNRHPLLYTFLLSLPIKLSSMLGHDYNWAIALFTAFQMILLEIEFLYLVHWMLKRKINRVIRIICSLYFVLFPLIPLYAVSVWKDTPFCMAVLFWTLAYEDLLIDFRTNSIKKNTIMKFIIGMFFVSFTRNNGIYVVIVITIILTLVAIREKAYHKLIISLLASIIAIIIIQVPIYSLVGVEKTDTIESFGIPLQQIGAVVSYEGNISEEEKKEIDKFIPYDTIKDYYSPCLADNLKWYGGLNNEYLSSNTLDFIKIWVELLVKNPRIYIKAYLLETLGFWNIDVSTGDAYVQNFTWKSADKIVTQTDIFEKYAGFSFSHFVNPRHYISPACFFWIFFVSTFFAMKRYGRKACLPFLPFLGIWATLMIATPIAVSFRYIAPLMFALPLVILNLTLMERNLQN